MPQMLKHLHEVGQRLQSWQGRADSSWLVASTCVVVGSTWLISFIHKTLMNLVSQRGHCVALSHRVAVAAFLEASTTYSSDSNPNLMISVNVKGAQMLRWESYKPWILNPDGVTKLILSKADFEQSWLTQRTSWQLPLSQLSRSTFSILAKYHTVLLQKRAPKTTRF